MFDQYGFMYILDTGNSRIQKWVPGASYGTTVISATMNNPSGMTFDLFGNLFVTDTNYQRILSFGLTCRKLLCILTFILIKFNHMFFDRHKFLFVLIEIYFLE
jgi:hypothetical protein